MHTDTSKGVSLEGRYDDLGVGEHGRGWRRCHDVVAPWGCCLCHRVVEDGCLSGQLIWELHLVRCLSELHSAWWLWGAGSVRCCAGRCRERRELDRDAVNHWHLAVVR